MREKKKGNAKLTEADVRHILANRHEMSARELAGWHQVELETVRRVLRGDTWKHVSVPAEMREDEETAAQIVQESGERLFAMQKDLVVDPALEGLSMEERLKRAFEEPERESTPPRVYDDPELAAKFAEAEVKARETADFFMGRNKKA